MYIIWTARGIHCIKQDGSTEVKSIGRVEKVFPGRNLSFAFVWLSESREWWINKISRWGSPVCSGGIGRWREVLRTKRRGKRQPVEGLLLIQTLRLPYTSTPSFAAFLLLSSLPRAFAFQEPWNMKNNLSSSPSGDISRYFIDLGWRRNTLLFLITLSETRREFSGILELTNGTIYKKIYVLFLQSKDDY